MQRMALVCPRCHHEFEFEHERVDRKIANLHTLIGELKIEIARTYGQPKSRNKNQQLHIELAKAVAMLNKVKDYKRLACDNVRYQKYSLLKEAIKDNFGEDGLKKCERYVSECMKPVNFGSLAESSKDIEIR